MAPLGRPGDQGDELSWMGVSVLYRRNRSAKKAYFLFTVIVLVIIGVLAAYLTPRGLSLYYQMRGGRRLDRVLRGTNDSSRLDVSCKPLPQEEIREREMLRLAVIDLDKAISNYPLYSNAYLQLGRAHCLLGNVEKAINSFQKFAALRPKNSLGHFELGFAYAGLCTTGDQLGVSRSNVCARELSRKILDELLTADIDPENLLALADNEYQKWNWERALDSYLLSEELGLPLSPEARFRQEIAFFASNKSNKSIKRLPEQLKKHTLSNSLEINPATLQWYLDATPLLLHPGGDPLTGVLWWEGDAITGVEVLNRGEYKITVRAQNTPPVPVQFQILVDFQPAATFELNRGDMSWQEFSTYVHLDDGYHSVGVRFLNDDNGNGIDRNLFLNRLKID